MLDVTPYVLANFKAIIVPIAPLITPQISPITSAHIFATFDAFFIRLSDDFAPSAFFVAFAWKCSSFATVTATPIISNKIPKNTTKINIITAKPIFNFDTPLDDMYDIIPDSIKVIITIIMDMGRKINYDRYSFTSIIWC